MKRFSVTKILIAVLIAIALVGFILVEGTFGNIDYVPWIEPVYTGVIASGVACLAAAAILFFTKKRKFLSKRLAIIGIFVLILALIWPYVMFITTPLTF